MYKLLLYVFLPCKVYKVSPVALFLSIFLVLTSCKRYEPVQITLDQNWTFTGADTLDWLPASVPGCVHTDLLANGKIADPFYRMNELAVKWVEQKDWVYRTSFEADSKLLSHEHIELQFDGLDTYADVYLNDSLLFRADNMFIDRNVDVKKFLRTGNNNLRIYFHSAVNEGMKKLQKVPYTLMAINEIAPENERTNVFTRKAPFHYGWDWGPRLVTCGIWKPVKLIAWNTAKLSDVYFKPVLISTDQAKYDAQLTLMASKSCKVDVVIKTDGKQTVHVSGVDLSPGQNIIHADFAINKPEFWWTNGLGNQKLYNIEVYVSEGNKLTGSWARKIGVRTIELVQDPDSSGHSFYFRLNGVPVFMKGANYIPSDIFTSRNTVENYRQVVEAAADANMNMLRIWGGGIYENDELYEMLDEHGILAWNDFMFACNLQPDDSLHLENIRKEAEYNVKRLRNHPSVALWCGNNENLTGWHEWNWKSKYEPEVSDALWNVYQKIFYDILPAAVHKYHAEIAYWPSSPQTYDNKLADRKSGDYHDWSIWFGNEPFSSYAVHVPRFVSEYGMQSFPEMKTIMAFANDSDLEYRSVIMEHRQRSNMDWMAPGLNGNEMILRYIKRYYREPKNFNYFVYLSQVMQAEGIKTAIESHRRNMPHCMGSLYWQINDCWPTMSWSGMDYFGRWKALHYFVRDAFQPLVVIPFIQNDLLRVDITNDLLQDTAVVLSLQLIDFKGQELWIHAQDVLLKKNSSSIYFEVPVEDLTAKGNPAELVLEVSLMTGNQMTDNNLLYFIHPDRLALEKPLIEKNVSAKGADQYEIKLRSNQLVKNISLTTRTTEGFFSNNFFDMLPGRTYTITYTGDGENLEDELVIQCVNESFN